ncbi:MAG: universal stress protein [Verrucomicrobiota bacterium]
MVKENYMTNDSSREPLAAPSGAGAEAVPALRFQTILVPVDFSAFSLNSLACAVAFARQFGSRLLVLHVVEIPYLGGGYGEVELPPLPDDLAAGAAERLGQIVQANVGDRAPATAAIRLGQPWFEITEAAREGGADLIILGTHGYTGMKHILMGSTAERVVRHAPCPVLVMRQRDRESAAVSAPVLAAGPVS